MLCPYTKYTSLKNGLSILTTWYLPTVVLSLLLVNLTFFSSIIIATSESSFESSVICLVHSLLNNHLDVLTSYKDEWIFWFPNIFGSWWINVLKQFIVLYFYICELSLIGYVTKVIFLYLLSLIILLRGVFEFLNDFGFIMLDTWFDFSNYDSFTKCLL